MLSTSRAHHDPEARRIRLLAGAAGALLLVNALFRLWPAPVERPAPQRIGAEPERLVAIEEVVRTTQAQQAAPPPPPPDLPPIEVEDEVELEEVDLTFQVPLDLAPAPPQPSAQPAGPPSDEASAPAGPTRGPQRVRGTQPKYPREAQRRNIEAEVRLRVMVEPNGRVTDIQIVDRKLIDGDRKTTVAELGYGLEEAAVEAAREWLFRPALDNGRRVRQAYEITMQFGTRR
jgi:protein TonB